ncbi:MAG: hypothetical protein IJ346_05540 [Clostridia bacterium]|nr:hypothetical protein [Clostridia bacterium]
MKYRLVYEYLFLPQGKEGIKLENETITGLSINVKFKVFYNGKEIFFEDNEPVDKQFMFDKICSCNLVSLLKCIYDKESFYKFLPTPTLEYVKSRGYDILYDVAYYTKDVYVNEYFSDGRISSKEEFEKIFSEHISEFNNIDNYPAQSTAYSYDIIEE